MPSTANNLREFLAHARRQSVLDWTLAYAAGAGVLWVVVFLLGQYLSWPDQVPRFALVALALGLAPMLTIVWHRDFDYEPHRTVRGLRAFALVCAAVGVALWQFAPQMFTPSLERILDASQRATPPARESIAVRSFRVVAETEPSQFIADAIHDDLIQRLGRIPKLAVVSHGAVEDLPESVTLGEMATALQARFVLSGELTREGQRLHLKVTLTEGAQATEIWTRTYERSTTDLLALEGELAEQVARSVVEGVGASELARLRRNPTESPAAYQAFIEGQHQLQVAAPDARAGAIAAFRRAILLDPNYARAWAGLADAYNFRADLYLPQEVWPVSSALARRAVALDPTLPEVQATLARILAFYDWNLPEAESVLRRAMAGGARCGDDTRVCETYYTLMYLMGRCDDALALARQLVAERPRDQSGYRRLALGSVCARRYGEAQAALARAEPLIDPARTIARANLISLQAFVSALDGKALAATHQAREALALAPKEPIVLANAGIALAIVGDGEGAETVLELFARLSDSGLVAPRTYRAEIHGWLGNTDEAIALLEEAFEHREVVLLQAFNDPGFDPLRDDPRFRALVGRMGGTRYLRAADAPRR